MEQEGGKLRFPFTWETLKGSHIHIPDLQRADKGLSSPAGHNLEVSCPWNPGGPPSEHLRESKEILSFQEHTSWS